MEYFLGVAIPVIVSLILTTCWDRIVAIPKQIKAAKAAEEERQAACKAAEEKRIAEGKQRHADIENRLINLEESVGHLPEYHQQSIDIRAELMRTDETLLTTCRAIQDSLSRLEAREKNAIRAELISLYQLFTDPAKNPMRAWSEMEHHAFFEQVADYEELGGNDYIHSVVLPAMHELRVIPMTDHETLIELMSSRK